MATLEEYDAAEAEHKKATAEITRLETMLDSAQRQPRYWATSGPIAAIADWPTAPELAAAIEAAFRTKERAMAMYAGLPENVWNRFSPQFPPAPLPSRSKKLD